MHTYTYTHRALGETPQTVSHPFEEGQPEAQGEATTYPKAEQQTRAKQSPDALGWAACVMPGHRVWTGVE